MFKFDFLIFLIIILEYLWSRFDIEGFFFLRIFRYSYTVYPVNNGADIDHKITDPNGANGSRIPSKFRIYAPCPELLSCNCL